jgi:hypothetical protein
MNRRFERMYHLHLQGGKSIERNTSVHQVPSCIPEDYNYNYSCENLKYNVFLMVGEDSYGSWERQQQIRTVLLTKQQNKTIKCLLRFRSVVLFCSFLYNNFYIGIRRITLISI